MLIKSYLLASQCWRFEIKKLILIEGMIGSGKSTTASNMAQYIKDLGANVKQYHEYALDHPIRTKAMDTLRASSPEGVQTHTDLGDDGLAKNSRVYDIEQWRILAEQCENSDSSTVIESTYLQSSVLPCFMNNAPRSKVLEVFQRIESRVATGSSQFFYLRPNDIEQSLRRIHELRGEPWSSWNISTMAGCAWARQRKLAGLGAVIGFYQAWEEVVDELFTLHSGPKLMLEAPELNWDAALKQMQSSLCN